KAWRGMKVSWGCEKGREISRRRGKHRPVVHHLAARHDNDGAELLEQCFALVRAKEHRVAWHQRLPTRADHDLLVGREPIEATGRKPHRRYRIGAPLAAIQEHAVALVTVPPLGCVANPLDPRGQLESTALEH